jgi:hypothetical protein
LERLGSVIGMEEKSRKKDPRLALSQPKIHFESVSFSWGFQLAKNELVNVNSQMVV